MKKIGLDVGSTTIKCVVIDENNQILFKDYQRHLSKIREMTSGLLDQIMAEFPGEKMQIIISGSAGMGIATDLGLPFVQEVYATRKSVNTLLPGTDTVVELGGEDAKILFLTNGLEVRMNGSCAGGTGAFIDQMASLMNVEADEMNELSKNHEKIYTIASRCGVFAKTDIQPLINQGARKEDIAASIFYAVVNQTIGGLAQGREIQGNVAYLGGPLTFFSELRKSFDDVLKLKGTCPKDSLYFVAMGAALSESADPVELASLKDKIAHYTSSAGYMSCRPLFTSQEEFDEFERRHKADTDNISNIDAPGEKMFLGIDAGSTTIKAVLCDENGNILYTTYKPNSGNPVPLIRDFLQEMYAKYPGINIVSSAVTGYGEDIIRNAFKADFGVVETIAHYTAAKKFKPEVDFIIDIGGQDIKCFRIRNGAIDNIFLNEACSSGCGSFLQTFAGALGYEMKDFAKIGLFADRPVDLGSRCTVFMNSSVKQAQKDGASVENISAGLSISVVKNALYKVIRCANADQLGQHIVVQGGTFLNNAVLRAFEQEIGRDVIRPEIAGIMGAYGAALYAMSKCDMDGKSSLITESELREFSYEVKAVTCNGCNNHCKLTINTFDDGEGGVRRFIAGNRCEKPLHLKKPKVHYNMYEYKNQLLDEYRSMNPDMGAPDAGTLDPDTLTKGAPDPVTPDAGAPDASMPDAGASDQGAPGSGVTDQVGSVSASETPASGKARKRRKVIGIPMALNMYELLPFWHRLWRELGFDVYVSSQSTRDTFIRGQHTIPSDTICFPAKLVHGHIEELIDAGVDAIFYPCMSYNVDEHKGDNNFNCPVVAYYPQVISANVKAIDDVTFINDFLGIHRPKDFIKHFRELMNNYFGGFNRRKVKKAVEAAFEEYQEHMNKLRSKADEFIEAALEEHKPVIVLAGRPYHVDPEVNHGIDKLICDLGAVVLSEDSISNKEEKFRTKVLNQWTYHARLYSSAKYVGENGRGSIYSDPDWAGNAEGIADSADSSGIASDAAGTASDAAGTASDPAGTAVAVTLTSHELPAPVARDPKLNDLDINLVQLVSFGCGVDAVTSDETRSIIEERGKIYTQIKIDEVTNTGAVKIRLRSLFAATGINEG